LFLTILKIPSTLFRAICNTDFFLREAFAGFERAFDTLEETFTGVAVAFTGVAVAFTGVVVAVTGVVVAVTGLAGALDENKEDALKLDLPGFTMFL
jgi:hypothetical protein